jgi:hypothetical protein
MAIFGAKHIFMPAKVARTRKSFLEYMPEALFWPLMKVITQKRAMRVEIIDAAVCQ